MDPVDLLLAEGECEGRCAGFIGRRGASLLLLETWEDDCQATSCFRKLCQLWFRHALASKTWLEFAEHCS